MEKNNEFEEMKQQLHQLQQRLDKQVEISERQARRAIKDGMGSLRMKDRRELILCILCTLVLPLVCLGQGLPIHFVIGTLAFLLANIVWQYQISFDDRNLAAMNLVEAARRLTKYKKNYNRSILTGFPLALCWVFWYGKVSGKLNIFDEDLVMLFTSILIGTSIGFAIGIKLFYLPKMRSIDRLLRQIEEVQDENLNLASDFGAEQHSILETKIIAD